MPLHLHVETIRIKIFEFCEKMRLTVMILGILSKLASNHHTNKFYFFLNENMFLDANTVTG